jgi:hypothetical protein
LARGELAVTADDLQHVLKALLSKGASVISIRNHTCGEHPQIVFVRYWGEGSALELAKALRFVLEVFSGKPPLEKTSGGTRTPLSYGS